MIRGLREVTPGLTRKFYSTSPKSKLIYQSTQMKEPAGYSSVQSVVTCSYLPDYTFSLGYYTYITRSGLYSYQNSLFLSFNSQSTQCRTVKGMAQLCSSQSDSQLRAKPVRNEFLTLTSAEAFNQSVKLIRLQKMNLKMSQTAEVSCNNRAWRSLMPGRMLLVTELLSEKNNQSKNTLCSISSTLSRSSPSFISIRIRMCLLSVPLGRMYFTSPRIIRWRAQAYPKFLPFKSHCRTSILAVGHVSSSRTDSNARSVSGLRKTEQNGHQPPQLLISVGMETTSNAEISSNKAFSLESVETA